jgi:hypothetical protein
MTAIPQSGKIRPLDGNPVSAREPASAIQVSGNPSTTRKRFSRVRFNPKRFAARHKPRAAKASATPAATMKK